MLVLSRRVGEALLIDGRIKIVVLAADRKGARLGVEAPADTVVLRSELVAEVAGENLKAATTQPGEWLNKIGLSSKQDRHGPGA